MTISCPHCHKPHRLPEGVLPGSKSTARCKGCGQRFILEPGETGLKTSPEQLTTSPDGPPGTGPEPPTFAELLVADALPAGPGSAPFPLLTEELDDSTADSPTAEILHQFPQLRELAAERFSFADLFSPTPSGGNRTRLNQFRARLLLATADLLNGQVLQPGEVVCKIARGSAYFPFEIPYANGLLTLPNNYYALVCTTHRLLLINLDFRGTRPVRYIFQVLYDEIGKISRGFFGTGLLIKIRNGGKWHFTTVQRALARDLTAFVKTRINGVPSGFYDGMPRRQLCPSCLTPLPGGLASCPACQAPFKTAEEALKRSLLLPGMGEIYLGYYFPGVSVLAGYLLTWLAAVILLVVDLAGGIWGAGLLLLTYHLWAGLMARRLARKGYLAERRTGSPADRPATPEPDGPQVEL